MVLQPPRQSRSCCGDYTMIHGRNASGRREKLWLSVTPLRCRDRRVIHRRSVAGSFHRILLNYFPRLLCPLSRRSFHFSAPLLAPNTTATSACATRKRRSISYGLGRIHEASALCARDLLTRHPLRRVYAVDAPPRLYMRKRLNLSGSTRTRVSNVYSVFFACVRRN